MSKNKPRPLPEELNLPSGGADSHAHLNMGDLANDLDQVLARAQKCGVKHICQVFLGHEAYLQGRDMFIPYPDVFFILGVHPHEAGTFSQNSAENILAHAGSDHKIKAIGEMGLDYYYTRSTPDDQKKAFIAQLKISLELDLPVVIHSRDAYQDTVTILKEMGFKNRDVLWHCFGQGPDQAREIMDLGWHISIPGSVTFKKNHQLCEAVRIMDTDRMLMETDCPFLAPEPYRGKTNQPALLGFTARKIAELRETDAAELWIKCGENCKKFFRLA